MGYSINYDSNQNNSKDDGSPVSIIKTFLSKGTLLEIIEIIQSPLFLEYAKNLQLTPEFLIDQLRNDIISSAVLEIIPELNDTIKANDKRTVFEYLLNKNYQIGIHTHLDREFFLYPALGCIYQNNIPIHFFDFL